MTIERVKVWQCIGCGRIEGPQPCIGVCQDRPVELANAADLDAALAQARMLGAVVRTLAWTTPRAGEWEHSYRALQTQARRVLDALPREGSVFENT